MADDADADILEQQMRDAARSARARADAAMAAARDAADAADRAEAAAHTFVEIDAMEHVSSEGAPVQVVGGPEEAAVLDEVGAVTSTAVDDEPTSIPTVSRRRRIAWRRVPGIRPTRTGVLAGIALIVLVAGVVVNVLLWNAHTDHDTTADRRLAIIAAAKQGVLNMTTVDYTQADRDTQRVLDSSTGQFRADFAGRRDAFVSVVEQAKVSTQGKTGDAGVEKINSDGSAVVLVSAISTVTNGAGADKDPRVWRLRVTVTPQDGGLKMSKVDFVP